VKARSRGGKVWELLRWVNSRAVMEHYHVGRDSAVKILKAAGAADLGFGPEERSLKARRGRGSICCIPRGSVTRSVNHKARCHVEHRP
jgi:hypothetical protein